MTKIETLRTKIEALQAELVKLEAEEATRITADKLPAGTTVTFTEGRGDNKSVSTGVVQGVTENAKGGTTVTILTGEGAGIRVAKPFIGAIVSIVASTFVAPTDPLAD